MILSAPSQGHVTLAFGQAATLDGPGLTIYTATSGVRISAEEFGGKVTEELRGIASLAGTLMSVIEIMDE